MSKDHPDRLRAAYRDIDSRMEQHYMTTAEKLIQRGVRRGLQQGRQQGLQQGLQQGAAELLVRQLEQRFGPLPVAVAARIRAATQPELERIAGAILTAPTLDAVFA